MTVSGHTILNMTAPAVSLALLAYVLLQGTATAAGTWAYSRPVLILCSSLAAAAALLMTALNCRRSHRQAGALRQLRESTGHLAAGNLKERLDIPDSPEYAQLAADFNRMAAKIETLCVETQNHASVHDDTLLRSERLTSVGFLAGGVAHQINNPLGIISGYAELTLRRVETSLTPQAFADIKQALQIIREECFRCKSITEKLLLLARPSGLAREPVSLARLVEAIAKSGSDFGPSRDRVIRTAQPDPADPLTVLGNATELRQALLNLTANALEAVSPGTGEVTLRASRCGQNIELCIIDNGRGMTPQVKQKAFEPFFSDHSPDGEPGLGLGLSIAHAIVQAHGGHIIAESDGPGLGSRFTLQFPAYAEISDEKAA